ncbi:MAG TPA: hypothetical protein VGE43_19470 [Acidimicrobiales bacterium]
MPTPNPGEPFTDEGGLDDITAAVQEDRSEPTSFPLIVNTDSDSGRTIYVGSVDPAGSYSLVAGDVWIEPA